MAKTKTWTFNGQTVEASSMKEAARLLGCTGYALWNATHPKTDTASGTKAEGPAPAKQPTTVIEPTPPAPPKDDWDGTADATEWKGLVKGDAVRLVGEPRGRYEFRRYFKSATQEYVEVYGGVGGRVKLRPVRPDKVILPKKRSHR